MTTTSTETGDLAPLGLISRFIGVITSPKATFQRVVAHPRSLGMLALTTVLVAFCAALPLTTDAGRQAGLDQQVKTLESFGMQVNDQMYDGMAKSMRTAPYTTGISILIVAPVIACIIAGILFAIFTAAMGGQATFKQVLAVVAHAGVISTLSQLFTGPLNYFRGSVSSATNLAVFLPMLDETSFLGRLFGMIDLFWIWYFVVLAIGLGVLYKRRTQGIAMTLFAIYGVIILVLAAVMSRFGGTN